MLHVFISWSGDLSGQLAQALHNWLQRTLQCVKPYCTLADMEKGQKWEAEISKHLKESEVCIIALTRESLSSQWIMFEAGAIRSVEKARVCAILFDLEITDVQGPLAHFQATKFSKADMSKLLGNINSNAGEQALPPLILEAVFNKWWPELECEVQSILSTAAPKSLPPARDADDLLQETLQLVRNIAQEQTEVRAKVDRLFAETRPRGYLAPTLTVNP